ncbi:CocE/NonD family hydrolase [Ketobacter sp.]|uniref:CocE/NonD family hydrolase n=1 Tax=Ketobacter sp. TaxID=2083498 RepID=UPI000F1C6812|nr:CocE/NonD family hydrolase [Ketobacter sp.]RLU00924.1 MAG: CocE/NonD family hydrolase [Ketobacter sp.]
MNNNFTKPAALLLGTLFLGGMLAACSGGDATETNSGSVPESTRGADSGNDAPTSIPASEQIILDEHSTPLLETSGTIYQRAAEYPKAVNLPLQFIDTINGKKLGVRVTLPADENGNPAPGPFPVILTQSAYNTNLLSLMLGKVPGNLMLGVTDSFIVRRGYAQVAVDVYGNGVSSGGWDLLGPNEQAGYIDAVEWADSQPWSNGKLGLAGVSYMAITSLFTAQLRPELVDAVFASLPLGDAMRGTVGIGGMLNGLFMAKWLQLTHFTATQNVPTALLNPKHMNHILEATDDHVLQMQTYFLPMINSALDGEPTYNYETDYWTLRSPMTHFDKIKAPTFMLGALHDLFQRDEPLMYEILKNNNVDTRLVIYDGSHFINFVATHIGNETVPPVDLLLLQWFDKYLKGLDTNIEAMPKVVQHVKNYPTASTPEAFRNDHYATATDWPHPLLEPERWYLRENEGLTRTPPTAVETGPQMTQPEHPYGYGYDANGLLGIEIQLNDGTKCSRSFDQWTLGLNLPKACFSNSDLVPQQRVIFESEPMAEDYYFNGPIQADIWIESTVTEAVVSVQIEEVSARQSLPITNGQLAATGRLVDESRSRFINGVMIQPYHYFKEETSQPLVPGEVVKMQVEVFPTSAIIRKGNKLRISISPSNQAQAVLNYPRQAMAEGGVTTIHISPEYPSSVVMPMVPTSALD